MKKLNPPNRIVKTEGFSFVNPSDNFKLITPPTSPSPAINNAIHAILNPSYASTFAFNFNPTIEEMSNSIKNNLIKLTDSPRYTIPIIAVPAAPSPVKMA